MMGAFAIILTLVTGAAEVRSQQETLVSVRVTPVLSSRWNADARPLPADDSVAQDPATPFLRTQANTQTYTFASRYLDGKPANLGGAIPGAQELLIYTVAPQI